MTWYARIMKLADLPQVRGVSAEEKLQLVDELWQDVARDLEQLEISAAEKELLDGRWAAFLRDPSSALTLEQFKTRVKARRR
jgi:putative addiction module component (TIGR02574 family)